MKTILIAGCGFVGSAAVALFRKAGWQVAALTRSEASAQAIAQESGIRAVACDIALPGAIEALNFSGFDAVLDCVSAGGGAEEYRRVYFEGAKNLLDALNPRLFLFTSSSSVYAQDDGSWVTEESEAEPTEGTGLALRSTEELVLSRGGMVARLTGIYGPGRSMLLRRFLEGSAMIEGEGSRHLNQIHRADAAAAAFFLLNHGSASGVFNVSDGDSPTQRDFYASLSEYFGRPLPSSGPADPQRRRVATDKRVSNAKLRSLGWAPAYPTFPDALRNDPELLARI